MEAVGPTGDQASLVVEPFDQAVGQPVADVCDDVVEALSDRPGYLDEGWQPAPAGPAHPGHQLVSDHVGLSTVEDLTFGGAQTRLEESHCYVAGGRSYRDL